MGIFGFPKNSSQNPAGGFVHASERVAARITQLIETSSAMFSRLEEIKKEKSETSSPSLLTSNNPAKYMQARGAYEQALGKLANEIKNAVHTTPKPQQKSQASEAPREETPKFGAPRFVKGG